MFLRAAIVWAGITALFAVGLAGCLLRDYLDRWAIRREIDQDLRAAGFGSANSAK